MRKLFVLTFVSIFMTSIVNAQELSQIDIDSEITEVQPMTGIVLWSTHSKVDTDAVSLEYSYMSYADVVIAKDTYDWTVVEDLLNAAAQRNHQVIMRFRFSYPGRTTTVPAYIKNLEDYNETLGESEGNDTWFPDWTHAELQRFTLAFYKEFAENYDQDNRLAFLQTGFGLWAEYHIYSGPFTLGTTFPSKAFQGEFIQMMDESFEDTFWSLSIDAASSTYSPFSADEDLRSTTFGLFDDSFMSADHAGYNTSSWNFFDRDRYLMAPAGGEFNYYTSFDQQNVLTEHVGAHGEAYESAAERFGITYMIGNDQPSYHQLSRIKAASMYSGYRFKINSFKSAAGASEVEIENVGLAPIYVNAYVAINGVRSSETLKLLAPGISKTLTIAEGGDAPVLTIESDEILDTEVIQFYGTVNEPFVYEEQEQEEETEVLSIDVEFGDEMKCLVKDGALEITSDKGLLTAVQVYSIIGHVIYENERIDNGFSQSIQLKGDMPTLLIVRTNLGDKKLLIQH